MKMLPTILSQPQWAILRWMFILKCVKLKCNFEYDQRFYDNALVETQKICGQMKGHFCGKAGV